MDVENTSTYTSSWIVHPWGICAWFIFFTLATIYEQQMLSVFFLLIFFISLASFFWSRNALKGVTVDISMATTRLFKNQDLEIGYSIYNGKFWPLIWIQWSQKLAISPAIAPLDEEEWLCRQIGEEKSYFYNKRFAWVLWYNTIKWNSIWKAKRRGVYSIGEVSLSSGDGFGLAAIEKNVKLSKQDQIIVYPALIPVSIDGFFDNLLGLKTGYRGFIEDTSLLKGTRNYQTSDPWKHINWRMLALNRPLQSNIYETFAYQPIHFILDVQSFIKNPGEFEDALSILASVIVGLWERNIPIGLSVPKPGSNNYEHHIPSIDEVELLGELEGLAKVELEGSKSLFEELSSLPFLSSSEQIYLVTFSYSNISEEKNLFITENKSWKILSYDNCVEDSQNKSYLINKVISMKALKTNKGDDYGQ